jgi:hypothetical protein
MRSARSPKGLPLGRRRPRSRFRSRPWRRLCLSGIRRDRADRRAGGRGGRVKPLEDLPAPVDLAGRDLDVEHDPAEVVYHPMLLELGSRRRFRTVIAMVASGSVRQTFLNLPDVFDRRRPSCAGAIPSAFASATTSTWRRARLSQATSARISGAWTWTSRPSSDAGGDAGLQGPLEDATKPLGAPALPYRVSEE